MKTYTLSKFARMVGVHPKTLQLWDRKGILKAGRTLTNRRFYTDEDLERYRRGPQQEREKDVTIL